MRPENAVALLGFDLAHCHDADRVPAVIDADKFDPVAEMIGVNRLPDRDVQSVGLMLGYRSDW